MSHLDEREFEEIVVGTRPEGEHVAQCRACRAELAGRRAMKARLRTAFESVLASDELHERVRRSLAAASRKRSTPGHPQVKAAPGRSQASTHVRRWLLAGLAAAAVIALVTIPLVVTMPPRRAAAAEAEFVRIHDQNVSDGEAFFNSSEPDKLAAYFKDHLGFQPAMPELGHGMSIRGCCVQHFRGRPVGSYVVDTPNGPISIIVVTDPPETFGSGEHAERDGHALWLSQFAHCNMVAMRLGGYTYCAVGGTGLSHEALGDLLLRLLSDGQ